MEWIRHKIAKPIVGLIIGVFGVCEVILPGVASSLKSAPFERIFGFFLGQPALKQLEHFADWKLNGKSK